MRYVLAHQSEGHSISAKHSPLRPTTLSLSHKHELHGIHAEDIVIEFVVIYSYTFYSQPLPCFSGLTCKNHNKVKGTEAASCAKSFKEVVVLLKFMLTI